MGANWLSEMEDVGGALVPAARVFLSSQDPPLPGVGVQGIRWLAAQLEEFVDRETNDDDDDRFVEGAGALLGLLLIEHLGGRSRERDGCHRVQLGRFGWFDPFGAIQDVLDADDPRGCLSECLSMAEREAAGNGPISRVVRIFADALRRSRPDLDIESQFELTVGLNNGASVDLSRLERAARNENDLDAADAARRIITMLPDSMAHEEIAWSEAAPRLLPRLVSERFLQSLPSEPSLYADDVGGDVRLALQLSYGTRARYVRRAEVDAWSPACAAARQQAIENLVTKSDALRLERITDAIMRIGRGDGLDGARLLLPDLAARMACVETNTWLAAAPHRDVLLLASTDAAQELSRRAEDAARRAPHPISSSLFVLTPQGPRPFHG
ncbi:MAG: hypothetical protein WCE62_11245 [Polyangiales bacterium]